MTDVTAAELEAACQALVRVQTTNLGLEVELPVLYPNGDFATVVVARSDSEFLVHDAGFADMALATSGAVITRKFRERLLALAAHYGCEFSNNRMMMKSPVAQLPLAVAVVANASRTIADQLLQMQNQPVFSFRQEVIERVKKFVGEQRVRANEPVYGRSGTEYSISAVVLDRRLSAPLAYIEAVKDADGVNKKFREFYDISLVPDIYADRIVLYDDNAHLRQGDLILLQDVSNVVRFSDAETRLRPFAEVD